MNHGQEQFEAFWRKTQEIHRFGRPDRQDPINRDDILNLKIALAIDVDVLDFLADQHIFS